MVPKELNFSWKHTVFFKVFTIILALCVVQFHGIFWGQKEKKNLLKLLILLLRMMSSRLCAMSQFIYLPFLKKIYFPMQHFDFFEHTRVHGWLFYIILYKKKKKCPLLHVLCKIIYYQNRKIHSVSKKMYFLFICKRSSE